MILIHRARDLDRAAPAMAMIHAACFTDAPWDESAFRKLLSNEAAIPFMIWEGENAMAMLLIQNVAGEGEIITLGVLPTEQRAGFGEAIVGFAHTELKKLGCKRVFLEVAASNMAARGLYKKLEYQVINKRKAYYPNGDDALMMEKIF